MPEYNPNARWTSKKKKVEYSPSEPSSGPLIQGKQLISAPQGSSHGSGKKVAIIVVAVLVGVGLVVAMWYLANRPAPAPVVGLDFAAPNQVATGDPFTYSVLYTNNSAVALRNASLVITLPSGVFFVGQPESQQTMTISVGDVVAGSSGKKDFPLLVTAGAGSVVQASSTLSYSTDASRGGLFSTSEEGSIAVGSGAVGLLISVPANVFSSQNFITTVSYVNTTNHRIDGVKIAMQYPQGFTFAQADPAPAFPGNASWNIGSLAAGARGTILITGNIVGKDTALYSISGSAVESVSGESYAAAAEAADVSITASPLAIGAVADNDPNYVAGLGDYLDYTITYTNLSNTTFQNVAITATLSGAMFDLSSVQSAAGFNSRTATLTWYTANTPELASVAPGGSGSVDLRVRTKDAFPIKSATDKNFTLGLHLTVSSLTVPAGTVASSTTAAVDVTNKVGGVVTLDAVGYRYEPTVSSIKNFGPYPPKVDQSTAYTIHWRVTDYSTDIATTTVSAYLQSGATCTGKVMSTIPAQPVCNPATGEITWIIPGISAGTGVLNAPVEAVFQVENMPAVNQVGNKVTLIGKTSLTTTDLFTGEPLSVSANPVDTDLPNDTAVTATDRRVTQ